MTLLEAFALGVLQGATEFLPISSSGHLAIAHYLLPSQESARSALLFDLVVHLGTLLAIVLVLRARVAELATAAFSYVPGVQVGVDPAARRWLWLIAAGSVPTAIIGLALRDAVETAHARPALVGIAWLVTAVVLIVSERIGARTRDAAHLGWSDALLIGSAQGLAVFPGISRSGATVAAALLRDANAKTAVEFSMLLSLPAILGANVLEFARADARGVSPDVAVLAVGFVAAFVVGAVALRLLQWAVSERKLFAFAGYCLVAGGGALLLG